MYNYFNFKVKIKSNKISLLIFKQNFFFKLLNLNSKWLLAKKSSVFMVYVDILYKVLILNRDKVV